MRMNSILFILFIFSQKLFIVFIAQKFFTFWLHLFVSIHIFDAIVSGILKHLISFCLLL